ncbi:MAG: hypothetical protein GY822_00470 [Deltaproteobacteria bacterium]|nr:hypothetical protein [Deltaproteobacteria bacterium]
MARFLAPLLLSLAFLTSACGTPSHVYRPADDVEKLSGDKVATQMVDALGGMAAYDRVKQIEFSFVFTVFGKELTRRFHAWDKTRGFAYIRFFHDEEHYEAWVRLADKTGVVKVEGERLSDEEAKLILKEAYGMWVNDTYWFIAPYKVFDPGVDRAYVDGELRISFNKDIGLTPEDVYLFKFDDDNRPQDWTFYLQGEHSAKVEYKNPVVLNDVTLYLKRVTAFGEVNFESLRVLTDKTDDRRFTPLLENP